MEIGSAEGVPVVDILGADTETGFGVGEPGFTGADVATVNEEVNLESNSQAPLFFNL